MLDKVNKILVLAHQLVRCREIHQHIGTSKGRQSAGRDGSPQVFAHINGNLGLTGIKDEIAAKWHILASNRYHGVIEGLMCSGKPALLIEFLVVGYIGLGNHTQHMPVLHHHSAVKQTCTLAQGSAHYHHHAVVTGHFAKSLYPLFGSIEQQLVTEEVGTGVGGYAQFGQYQQLRPRFTGGLNALAYFLHIEIHIGHIH